jgi:hypothetical protein
VIAVGFGPRIASPLATPATPRARLGIIPQGYFSRRVLVGVSFYKVYTQHNFDGAVSLLDRGLAYLAGFPDQCQDVDVATLRLEAMRCRDALAQLGREQFRQLDPTLLPTIMVQEHDLPVASD